MRSDLLHVVTMVSNPVRYAARYRLFHQFVEDMKDAKVKLTVVEVAFGDRQFEVPPSDSYQLIQLKTFDELWVKENAINIGISRLPADWQYVAWIDSDIAFTRPDWAKETVHQLQHHMVVQLFSKAVDLTPDFEILHNHNGFVYSYHKNNFHPPAGPGDYGQYQEERAFWHPGYAWGARREAIDSLGGLIDFAILGSADHHMAMALIGEVGRSVPNNVSPRYLKKLKLWEEKALRYLMGDVGYVPGTIYHFWHGKKASRKYVERWEIIRKNKFDPDLDLIKDWQGLWQLQVTTKRQERLRDEIRVYFRQRNEDGIDL